jgi:GAF domain-containing protein
LRLDVESSGEDSRTNPEGTRPVPIDSDALASSITGLAQLSPVGGGLERALEQVIEETDRVLAVDGAGLMLLTEEDVLRYAVASDERGRLLETIQEQVGEGPCVDAFDGTEPTVAADVTADRRWPSFGRLARQHQLVGVLGVAVGLENGAVGTLNVYSTEPHEWDDGEIEAIQAYARIVASVLRMAADAQLQGKVAAQLQYALDHRVIVEQAKGVLMEREGIDQRAAFELLRRSARSNRERVLNVARRVVSGEPLERPTSSL